MKSSLALILVLAVVSQIQTVQSDNESKWVTSGKCPEVTLGMCEAWATRDGKKFYVHGRAVSSLVIGGCYKSSVVDGYFFSPHTESGRDCSATFPCLCLKTDLAEVKQKKRRSVGCWSRKQPGCIAISNIVRYRGASLRQCKHACNKNPDCVAIEFFENHGGNYSVYEEGDCQLNNDINKDKVRRCDGVHNNLDCYYKKTCSEGVNEEVVQDDIYTVSSRGRMSGSDVSEEGRGVNEDAAPVATLPLDDDFFEEDDEIDDDTEDPVTDDPPPIGATTDDPPPPLIDDDTPPADIPDDGPLLD